jgi:hypothetical protein
MEEKQRLGTDCRRRGFDYKVKIKKKDYGICPMCHSNEVYMTEDDDNLYPHGMLMFSGGQIERWRAITLIFTSA